MELQKVNNNQVSKTGEQLLQLLRDNWLPVEIEVERVVMDEVEVDGIKTTAPVIKKVMEKKPRLNKALNYAVSVDLIPKVMAMIPEQDSNRIAEIIKSDSFEVMKALQVYKVTPEVIMNDKIRPKTFHEAREINSPSLATYKKYKGEPEAIKIICAMLLEFSSKFSGRNKLSNDDILNVSGDILNDFYAITIADLKFILNKAVTDNGKDSKVYSLDYATILQIIDRAYVAKLEEGFQHSLSIHHRNISSEKDYRNKIDPTSSAWEIEKAKFLKS